MTPEGKPGMRRYGTWAGNPHGQPENVLRCVERVHGAFNPGGYQCNRKRGHGKNLEYCAQHAKRYPQESEGRS